MINSKNIYHTLQHRLEIFDQLAQNIEEHAYLLPELLIKTIRDSHRVQNEGISHLNSIQILEILHVECTEEERDLLYKCEISLRKAKDYQELVDTYDKNKLISIAHKLKEKLL